LLNGDALDILVVLQINYLYNFGLLRGKHQDDECLKHLNQLVKIKRIGKDFLEIVTELRVAKVN
jgi:hypothetical protein